MSEYTKGPWHLNTTIFEGEPVGWEVVGRQEGSANPIIVGMLKCSPSKSISKNIKDAQLIAAAPDMLEALDELILDISINHGISLKNMIGGSTREALNKAFRAIKKAKGEEV